MMHVEVTERATVRELGLEAVAPFLLFEGQDRWGLETAVYCIHCERIFRWGDAQTWVDPRDSSVPRWIGCAYWPDCDGLQHNLMIPPAPESEPE